MKKSFIALLAMMVLSVFGNAQMMLRTDSSAFNYQLAVSPKIVSALEITSDQIRRINNLLAKMSTAIQDKINEVHSGGSLDQDSISKEFSKLVHSFEELHMDEFKSILSEKQFKRYLEIELQTANPDCLIRKSIVAKLGLNANQLESLKKLVAGIQPQIAEIYEYADREMSNGTIKINLSDKDNAKIKEIREKAFAEAKKLMTEEQVAQYTQMLGSPF